MIGKGSCGQIYVCRCRQTGDDRVVKVMQATPRALNEIMFAVEMYNESPKHFVKIFAAYKNFVRYKHGVVDCFLVVMERCTFNLHNYMQRSLNQRMLEGSALAVFRSLAEGVYLCHLHGIVHRDINPENILRVVEGNFKISDFGWAKRLVSSHSNTNEIGSRKGFIAPEVLSGHYSYTIDVFSLGMVLFYMLSGNFAFDDSCTMEKFHNASVSFLTTDPHWQTISPGARSLVAAMMDGDPATRPTIVDVLNHRWLCPYVQPATDMASAAADYSPYGPVDLALASAAAAVAAAEAAAAAASPQPTSTPLSLNHVLTPQPAPSSPAHSPYGNGAGLNGASGYGASCNASTVYGAPAAVASSDPQPLSDLVPEFGLTQMPSDSQQFNIFSTFNVHNRSIDQDQALPPPGAVGQPDALLANLSISTPDDFFMDLPPDAIVVGTEGLDAAGIAEVEQELHAAIETDQRTPMQFNESDFDVLTPT